MKKILLKDYRSNMGIFIDINNEASKVVKDYKHIRYEELMINYSELLDKNKKYYIYCNGGVRSKKAVSVLSFYGYDVTLVYK
ncbi:MAG: rhodanese-like domain-containing protein [Candidatus Coprovivens sp.]